MFKSCIQKYISDLLWFNIDVYVFDPRLCTEISARHICDTAIGTSSFQAMVCRMFGVKRLLIVNPIFGYPDSKVHGANMGPIWGRQDPDGSHVGPMNFVIWVQTPVMFESTHHYFYQEPIKCPISLRPWNAEASFLFDFMEKNIVFPEVWLRVCAKHRLFESLIVCFWCLWHVGDSIRSI